MADNPSAPNLFAYDANGRILIALTTAPLKVADAAALSAVVAANRADGDIAVKLDTDDLWTFDSGSSAAATAWCIVPDAGTGRWLRKHVSLVDLSTAGSATLGAILVGIRDAGSIITATTVEAALQELAQFEVDLGTGTSGKGAAKVLIIDAGTFTAQTTVEGALQELYQSALTAQGVIDLPPSAFMLATGAPLAAWSNGASAVPGTAIVDSKACAIRWNDHATPNAILTSFLVPPDMDIAADATLTIRASKTGAAVGDAVTFLVAAYNQVVGALHDADSDFGGTTGAMTGNATAKTEQAVTLTLALANLAAYPARVTLTIKPTDGTLGTDDLCLLGATVTYKKKLLTS